MTRDPLEELFGKNEPEDAHETPEPYVAPEPLLAPEPFAAPDPFVTAGPVQPRSAPAPVQQSRDELPTAPVPAGGKRPNAMLPWIIVGGVTVLALIGSLIFISTVNGADDTKPETSTEPEVPSTETESPTTDPTEEIPEETTPPSPEATKPPKVDVGNTVSMDIGPAGISVEASYKLEPNGWFVPSSATNRVTWESNLMNSFPDSCAAMRSPVTQSPWGIEQDATGKWIVVRPAGTCEAAPDLYNEVWGLMQAVADSAKPLGD